MNGLQRGVCFQEIRDAQNKGFCVQCGEEFVHNNGRQRFCNDLCRCRHRRRR